VSYYHDDPTQEVTSSRSFLPGFLVLILLITGGGFFVKSTLAANISLSSGRAIEFGQSVSQTVACSGSQNVTVTPKSSFVNAANGTGTYYLGSITVADIPTSCYGVNFKLSAFGPSSSTPLALYNSTSTEAVVYNNSGSFEVRPLGSAFSISGGSGTFTVTFNTPVAEAYSVSKVTIQSASGQTVQLGATGPGGGVIFYIASTPFTCGPTRSATCTYLEAAPSGWNGGVDPTRRWANATYQSTIVNNATSPETATATAIGWGYRNTRAIILQGNSDAATIAAALADSYAATVSGVTYDDWYLPSRDELNQMCKWQRGITGDNLTNLTTVCTGGATNTGAGAPSFLTQIYWSSSEADRNVAFRQNFGNGRQFDDNKAATYYVRPVRAF